MGSNTEKTSALTRKSIHPKIMKPKVESLKECVKLMTNLQRITFIGKYGNILQLLEVDVQVEAISVLYRFYDPPMRCFTFRDFQMAPTIEEFSQILGYPLDNMKPYLGRHYPWKEVAMILKVKTDKLESKKQNRNRFEGIPQKYLEERMKHLADIKDWVAFMDVLALTIYGVILFPHIDEYVDLAAINAFLAFREYQENPAPAILADTYCTFTHCHERKGRKLLCCLPVLYVWLITHVFNNKYKTSCPMEDFKMCDPKIKSGLDWDQHLTYLNERTVRWYLRWREIHEVIYRCGNFPNVPLMGTKGCINYNPSVALRQLCYPMMNSPTEEMVTPFSLYGKEMEDSEMIRRIRRAWDQVIRKGKELGKRSTDAKEGYRQWVKDRAQKINLSFDSTLSSNQEIPVQTPFENEEVKELKVALLKLEEEKRILQGEIVGVRRAYEKMKTENSQKTASLEIANKRAKIEEDRKLHFQNNLRVSDESLAKRRGERDKALNEVEKLKQLLTSSKIAERNAKRHLEDLERQLGNVVVEYKKRVEDEKQLVTMYHELWRKEQAVGISLRDRVEEQQGIIGEYEQENMYWMDRCSKLVWLANGAIQDFPEYLKKAEAMINPLSTPREITEFIEYCENLMEIMGDLIRRGR